MLSHFLLPTIQAFFSWLVSALVAFNFALLLLNIGLRIWDRLMEEEERVGHSRSMNPVGDTIVSKLRQQDDCPIPASKSAPPGGGHPNHKLMAVLGSGGHTMEMLKLLSSLADGQLFQDRVYVVALSDPFSGTKVLEFEQNKKNDDGASDQQGKFTLKSLPRAREVGQSYVSSIWTTLVAAWHSFLLIWSERPDVVLSNGPAIGLPICLFARLLQLLHVHQCRIVFIESVCRVQTLSLTGRLLYYLRIPHVFLVQWPHLQRKYPKSEFIGRLV